MEEVTQVEGQEQQPITPEGEAEQVVTKENAEPSKPEGENPPEKTFTQKELDEIIAKRLERERETVSKKAAQEARDAWVAEQGWQDFKGNPIKTEAQYKEALKEQEIRKKYEGKVDDEILQELIESKKFREQYQKQQEESNKQAKQQQDYSEFLEYYEQAHGKEFNHKEDVIPAEVWAEVDKGKSLVDAYTRYENQRLKDQIAELTKQKEIEKQNEENAAASTGSVTGQGGKNTGYFTPEQVEAMSESEVNKHWDVIQKSMKAWKK